MNINDGGPAFPNIYTDMEISGRSGMTLRDYFAVEAMARVRASQSDDDFARACYRIADAMIKARGDNE